MTGQTTECRAEVVKAECSESREWGFVADIRIRLRNPDGKDVVALRTYKTQPKHDGLVGAEQDVHEDTKYWWPDAYPANGDTPFASQSSNWRPNSEGEDALLQECVEIATHDPEIELQTLKHRGRSVRQKLEGDR